jgi:hypothetical protein
MESTLDPSTVLMAGSAKTIADVHVATFEQLVEMLVLNPTVKQLLAAGYTHAQVARTVHIRKQQVGRHARTVFHPVTLADGLHSIDVWALALSLWGDSEQRLQLAIDTAFEWDATRLADVAPPEQNPEQYRIGSVADELDTYGCAFARCEAARPYTPRQEDSNAARIDALRARAAGASELDLSDREDEILGLLRTPVVPEVPDFLFRNRHLRYTNTTSNSQPWAVKYEQRHVREHTEMKRYGQLLPTLPDDSNDPRVLARDLVLLNLGDARVVSLPSSDTAPFESRSRVLERFAGVLGVRLDESQTYAEGKTVSEVESEILGALDKYLNAELAARSSTSQTL